MERIGIIFGGKSGEHEVSLLSARAVADAFDRSRFEIVTIGITKNGEWKLYEGKTEHIADGTWERYASDFRIDSLKELVDFVFPVLHGPYGEDGTIQGLLEMMDMPYAGCGVLASALCMDKVAAKMVFEREGLPTCGYALVYAEDLDDSMDSVLDNLENKFMYPVFVKPSNMGSSVGITKAGNRKQLKSGLLTAAKHDRRIIVEEGLDCREIEVGVTGNHHPEAAAAGEIIQKEEFYDYKAKYTDGSGTELSIPAGLPEDAYNKIRELAVQAYKVMDCSGYARVDFFVERKSGRIYINEINTIPGFTKYSMFPLLCREAGLEFSALVERIVKLGYEKYHFKNNR